MSSDYMMETTADSGLQFRAVIASEAKQSSLVPETGGGDGFRHKAGMTAGGKDRNDSGMKPE
jgi:hypothetical protein